MGLSISATSRMLVKFKESCRVIERKAGEDKREVQVILTDKGKDLLNEGVSLIEDVLSHYQLDKMKIIIEKKVKSHDKNFMFCYNRKGIMNNN
ncbi:hypothetical protein MMJ53_06990 [Enterococcus cecorum]|uniref:hypothetical protein n=3 Tax=Enterococcus cecorum TaxID=44008 RepID=UPI001FABAF60|nr:hypothetical protein [Enterococcus cecorum]MCJ0557938.1 hypothetical protein [Enterococcus cecorum]